MDVKMMIQSTPNPNALKFVLNVPVKKSGNVTYKNASQCEQIPLAKAIFSVSNISEVYFFDNYVTVTQDGNANWDDLEEQIRKIILENIGGHNPDLQAEELKKVVIQSDNPELTKINAILDQTVRPALQMDGGDLQIISLEGNTLKINYQGACGSCPSSSMGTMKAIENLLQDQYNPNIVVELA